MKAFFLYLFIALLAVSAQAMLFNDTKPDLVLVLVFFYSLRYGRKSGMIYAAVTGLLIDSANGLIFGPKIISLVIISYVASSVRQKLFRWNVVASTVIIACFSALDIFLVYICFEIFTDVSFTGKPFGTSLMQVVYTIIFGLLAYPFLSPEEENRTLYQAGKGI